MKHLKSDEINYARPNGDVKIVNLYDWKACSNVLFHNSGYINSRKGQKTCVDSDQHC